MKSVAAAALAVAGSAAGAIVERQSSAPVINTPMNLVTCEVTAITWTGGSPPFFVSVYPGGTTSNPYIQFASVPASPIEWKVNISAGTAVTYGISDGHGLQNANQQVTITAGPDTSCVGQSTNVTSGSSSVSGSSSSSSSGSTSAPPSSSSSHSSSSSSSSSPTGSPTGTGGSGAGMVKAGASTLGLGLLGILAAFF